MIAGAVLVGIITVLPTGMELILLLSATYSDISAFGPAGIDIATAFTIHLCSLVIALGLICIGLSKHYTPELKPYLTWGVLIWFVLDVTSSLYYNYEFNVIPNLIFLSGFYLVFRSLPDSEV